MIGMFYSFQRHNVFSAAAMPGTEWDLIGNMKKGDYSLLKMPFRILWPKPERDAYLLAWLNNLSSLVGLGAAVCYWPQRRTLKADEKLLFALRLACKFECKSKGAVPPLLAYIMQFLITKPFKPLMKFAR